MRTLSILLGLGALTGGCVFQCESVLRYGVSIEVTREGGGPLEELEGFYSLDGGPEQSCDVQGDFVTCGFSPGEYFITLDALGVAAQTVEVEAQGDACGVETEVLAVELQGVDCTDEVRPSVEVTVVAYDPAIVDDADVSWSDFVVQSAGCDPVDDVWWCGEEVPGDITVRAVSGAFVASDTVTVERGDCHVLTQQVTLDLTP